MVAYSETELGHMSETNERTDNQPDEITSDWADSPESQPQPKRHAGRASLLGFVAVVARRWKLIFFATFFAGIGTVLFSIYTVRMPSESPYNPLPDFYRPEAQILLTDQGGSDVASAVGNANGGARTSTGTSSAGLAEELIRGNTLIDQVIQEFALLALFATSETPITDARRLLRDNLVTEFADKSGIMRVSYQHVDPVFATDILQRVVSLLEQRFNFLTRERSTSRTQAIDLQLQQLEDDVQLARDALATFQTEFGIFNPQIQSQQTLELITQFREQRFEREVERDQILALVRNEDDPQIQRIDQEIGRIDTFLSELETGFRTYSQITIPLEQLGPLTAQFSDLQRDLLLKESIYSTFLAERLSAQLGSQDTTRRFQVIEPPEVPEIKAGPQRSMIVLVVTGAAFVLALLLALVLELLRRARLDPSESRKLLEIRDQFRLRRER